MIDLSQVFDKDANLQRLKEITDKVNKLREKMNFDLSQLLKALEFITQRSNKFQPCKSS